MSMLGAFGRGWGGGGRWRPCHPCVRSCGEKCGALAQAPKAGSRAYAWGVPPIRLGLVASGFAWTGM